MTETWTHCSVTLLGLAGFSWVDDQSRLVLLQPPDIELLSLLAQVPPPVVNGDSDTLGLLPPDASELELVNSEPSTACSSISSLSSHFTSSNKLQAVFTHPGHGCCIAEKDIGLQVADAARAEHREPEPSWIE